MSIYFNRKEELKAKATKHYKMMEAGMKEETSECVKNTRVYGGDGIAVSSAAKKEYGPDWMQWVRKNHIDATGSVTGGEGA